MLLYLSQYLYCDIFWYSVFLYDKHTANQVELTSHSHANLYKSQASLLSIQSQLPNIKFGSNSEVHHCPQTLICKMPGLIWVYAGLALNGICAAPAFVWVPNYIRMDCRLRVVRETRTGKAGGLRWCPQETTSPNKKICSLGHIGWAGSEPRTIKM